MRDFYLFEIEADEKPIFTIGEWEKQPHLTSNGQNVAKSLVAAYGEVEGGKYIRLYEKGE